MSLFDVIFDTGAARATEALRRIVHDTAARAIADGELELDGATVSVRVGGQIVLVVARTIDLAGAVIRIVPGHIGGTDRELIAAWIDPPIERAIAKARGARASVSDGEAVVEPGDKLGAAARLAAALATRPLRLAKTLAAAADTLGGTASAERWALDDEYALTFPRPGLEVTVDFVRRRPILRTRARVPSSEIESERQLTARVRGLGGLTRKVGASSYALVGAEIHVTVDGVLTDPERLGELVELSARLGGVERVSAGPYR